MSPAGTDAPRILVVDDVETNRGILRRLVQRAGFRVTEADSGYAAIELVTLYPPNLILLDMTMPGFSGLQTLAILRQRYDAAALPIIMVTANHGAEVARECLAAGANDYVTKPVQWPMLQARIQTHLGLHEAHMQLLADKQRLEVAQRFKAVG
ncbi:MAG: response regulator [Hyphomonadaceae bacterium]|nr:response regulator [Hyphomonadaceae bacterium]